MIRRFGSRFRLSLWLGVASLLAAMAIIPYQLALLAGSLSGAPLSPVALLGISALQAGVQVFILSYIGLTLAQRVQLGAPLLSAWVEGSPIHFSQQWLVIAIVGGTVSSVSVLVLDKLVFAPLLPAVTSLPPVVWWKGLLAVFYGGIVEETLVRLFGMTLAVWLVAKAVRKATSIPAACYWIGIFIAALVFGALHLPFTASVMGGLTATLVVRGLLLNAIPGIVFGCIYWRQGFEYAVISHMTADVILHVFPALLR